MGFWTRTKLDRRSMKSHWGAMRDMDRNERKSHDIEDLSQKYKQPKNIEQYGIEQVPEAERTVRWYDIFFMVINFLMNPGMILIGGMAVASGLSFWAAIASVVLGIAVAFVAYLIMATIGVDYGVSGAVATRMVYGVRGSKYTVSLFRAATGIYWFSIQTIVGAAAIAVVINKLFQAEVSIVAVSLIFAIFQIVVATFGYNWLKFLSRIALPIKLIGLIAICYMFMTHDDPNYAIPKVFGYEGTVGWGWGVFIVSLNSLTAIWLSMTTDAADFCRYSRTRVDMWIGTMAAACIGTFTSAFVGAYSAAATLGKVPNGLEGAATIASSGFALFMILLVVVLDNWTINVLNIYTSSLSVVNMVPKLGRFWATLLVSVIGVGLSIFPSMLNKLQDTMTVSGIFYAPLAAVVITDYVFVKKGVLLVDQLFEENGIYRYSNGWNIPALTWTIIGFVVYQYTPPEYFQSIVCIVLTGFGYYFHQKLNGQVQKQREMLAKMSA
ncbi:hypothetical protein EDM56_20015 [Brevibacillus fluminis]|uniref:Cytosine permease n=2 Tax=Brevibacillus fluminis TaxID=511487 RepID=A0A3M8DA88_9BACL|nr:hypothetical protein EDM56_20015 [Brevibacillus fluminis]